MLLNHSPTKILITGKSSSGKSTYWNRYILNSFKVKYQQIYVFDHEGEFAYRNSVKPCYNSADLETAYESGLIVYDPVEQWPGQVPEAFDWFCSFVFELRRWIIKNASENQPSDIALFACDELQKITDVYSLPLPFTTLLETGRRYGIDTLFIGQQINLIHNRIRNQTTECVTFAHIDPLILDAMQAWGFNPDDILSLDYPGEYLIRSFINDATARGHLFKEKKLVEVVDKGKTKGDAVQATDASALAVQEDEAEAAE